MDLSGKILKNMLGDKKEKSCSDDLIELDID